MKKLMAVDVSRLIMDYVQRGGWLGAAWPRYVLPDGTTVTQHQLNAGYAMAALEGALSMSEDNFRAAARATFEA